MSTHARMQTVHAPAEADAEGYTLTVEAADTVRRYIRDGKLNAWQVAGLHTLDYRIHPDDLGGVHARTQAPAYADARMHSRMGEANLPVGDELRTAVQTTMRVFIDEQHQTRQMLTTLI